MRAISSPARTRLAHYKGMIAYCRAAKFIAPVVLYSQAVSANELVVSFTIDHHGRLVDNGWKEKAPVWTSEKLDRIVTPLLSHARL